MPKGDYFFPLFYQKLTSSITGWTDEQVGAYLRLLIYQYSNGYVEDDMEIIKRIAPAAKKNWKILGKKFEKNEDGNLRNPVMNEIREKRLKRKKINIENGKKGGRPATENDEKNIPMGSIIDGHPNMVNGYSLSFEDRGMGKETLLVPEMMQYWKLYFPQYAGDQEEDFPALFKIACKIKDWKTMAGRTEDNREPILQHWNELCTHIRFHDHYSDYSITRINNHFQSVIQSFNNAANKRTPKKSSGGKSEGANQLLDSLKQELSNHKSNGE